MQRNIKTVTVPVADPVDPATLNLAALRLSTSGQHAVVPFDLVHSIGRDAVMVAGDDGAEWIATAPTAEGLATVGGDATGVGIDVIVVRTGSRPA